MVELVPAGRGPVELARELEPSAQTMRNWVAQSERDEGRGDLTPSIHRRSPKRGNPTFGCRSLSRWRLTAGKW
jgi:transposase-like protein